MDTPVTQTTVHCLCNEPYLRAVAGHTTMYYVYCLASRGPNSEPVTRCVSCERVLDIGTTEEISHGL